MTDVSNRPTINVAGADFGRPATSSADRRPGTTSNVFELRDVSVFYSKYEAVHGTTMTVGKNQTTALFGRRFQKPNPFPKSIYDNVAYGLRINNIKGNMDDMVEQALRGAALWDEVKDKLKQSGQALSGGQQQRLCIARTIAVKPEVILMDEPCSALDPIVTSKIEDLMYELAFDYTIVIVTHNMQQAARVSNKTAFFTAEVDENGIRHGRLVEYEDTPKIFTAPKEKRTEDYITGRFG